MSRLPDKFVYNDPWPSLVHYIDGLMQGICSSIANALGPGTGALLLTWISLNPSMDK